MQYATATNRSALTRVPLAPAVVGQAVVDNCMAGYNSSIFAYGQTGSGKTHTVMGVLDDKELVRPQTWAGASTRLHLPRAPATYRSTCYPPCDAICDAACLPSTLLANHLQQWRNTVVPARNQQHDLIVAAPCAAAGTNMLCSAAPAERPGPARV